MQSSTKRDIFFLLDFVELGAVFDSWLSATLKYRNLYVFLFTFYELRFSLNREESSKRVRE